MPTMTLTVTGVPEQAVAWVSIGGIAAVALASDDGTSTSGASYVTCSTDGAGMNQIDVSNPTVASGDVDSITSVRFLATGRCPSRGSGGSDVDFEFDTPSGFSETINFNLCFF